MHKIHVILMKIQDDFPPITKEEAKGRLIRFRGQKQIDLITSAANQQRIPFNTFVTHVCEVAATALLKRKPNNTKKDIAAAVNEVLTER